MRNIMLAFDIARFVQKEVRTAIIHEKTKNDKKKSNLCLALILS